MTAVGPTVALHTKCDEVYLGILSRVTAEFLMVDLDVGHRAARLTPPAVTTENLLAQLLEGLTGRLLSPPQE